MTVAWSDGSSWIEQCIYLATCVALVYGSQTMFSSAHARKAWHSSAQALSIW